MNWVTKPDLDTTDVINIHYCIKYTIAKLKETVEANPTLDLTLCKEQIVVLKELKEKFIL